MAVRCASTFAAIPITDKLPNLGVDTHRGFQKQGRKRATRKEPRVGAFASIPQLVCRFGVAEHEHEHGGVWSSSGRLTELPDCPSPCRLHRCWPCSCLTDHSRLGQLGMVLLPVAMRHRLHSANSALQRQATFTASAAATAIEEHRPRLGMSHVDRPKQLETSCATKLSCSRSPSASRNSLFSSFLCYFCPSCAIEKRSVQYILVPQQPLFPVRTDLILFAHQANSSFNIPFIA